MANKLFESVCGCGNKFEFSLKKPTRMQQTIARATCTECLSKYIFECSVDKDKPGRVLKIESDALEISSKLSEILKAKTNDQNKET